MRLATPTKRPGSAATPSTGIRSQILEAALAEFGEHGFGDASLAAIARKLGVTAPLLLYHFGSKANLWREAVDVLMLRCATVIEAAVEDGRNMDGASALRLVLRRFVYFLAANRAMYRLLRDEGAADHESREWLVSRHLAPLFGQLETIYDRAVADGGLRAAPFHTTIFMILGSASQYLESRSLVSSLYGRYEVGAQALAAYAEQVIDFCFEGIASDHNWHAHSGQTDALRVAVG
ncbi:MAG TPA: TetR/AcrR family transcriptional regulator [Candidatus Limnocylindrales bacterium]|nr:TetR/AcrR family transcriptional regulator [Candidatus Limnocylindrales bacterium]